MAAATQMAGKQTAIMMIGAAILAIGATVTVIWFQADITRMETDIARLTEEYPQMVTMCQKIATLRQKHPKTVGGTERADDILEFLERKAVQAGIPRAGLTIGKEQDRKSGGWKELSYSVQLRGASKESPIPRTAVVDFLRLVEEERPSIKSKNLSLMFAGDNLNTVALAFSYFQREP